MSTMERQKWTVLLRGNVLEPLAFAHNTSGMAWNRAVTLADLHNAKMQRVDSFLFIVDASDYYNRRGRKS